MTNSNGFAIQISEGVVVATKHITHIAIPSSTGAFYVVKIHLTHGEPIVISCVDEAEARKLFSKLAISIWGLTNC
jgi:hypothetical protein